jgi:uncharacterized membrane protein YcgQ (UPF0703/DUF1980 family)
MSGKKTIDEVFGDEVPDVTEIELEDCTIVSDGTNLDIAQDYILARGKIVKSIMRSSVILDSATVEALGSPNPRALEAFSAISKNLNESTANLMKLHEQFRNIEKEETKPKEGEEDTAGTVKATLSSLLKEINRENSALQ